MPVSKQKMNQDGGFTAYIQASAHKKINLYTTHAKLW